MKFYILLFLYFPFTSMMHAQNSLIKWTLEQETAAWQPRDSQGEVVYNGYMWILGGWHNSYEAPPRDVWRSKDGRDWELVSNDAPWIHSDLPMSITFKGKMWMMGGVVQWTFRKPVGKQYGLVFPEW